MTGGDDPGDPVLASAELYDPSSGTWSAAGSLTSARWGTTATLLKNGKALVIGGITGQEVNDVTSSAELYDEGSGS